MACGRLGALVGFNRDHAFAELRCGKMLAIADRSPGEQIFGAFRRGDRHFEKHDGFIEMIEVVGGKAGCRIDIGARQALRAAVVSQICGRNAALPAHLPRPPSPAIPRVAVSLRRVKWSLRSEAERPMCGRYAVTSSPEA